MDGMASASQGGSFGSAGNTGSTGNVGSVGGQGVSNGTAMGSMQETASASFSSSPSSIQSGGQSSQTSTQTWGQTSETSTGLSNGEGAQSNQQAANQPEQRTAYTPDAYSFTMPNAVANDAALVSRIQDFCAGAQLSPQQAQAAMAFWQSEQNAIMEQGLQQCEQSLKETWQGAYGERLEQARTTLKVLDARMGGRLMPLVKGPLGNSPVFAEMLHHLSDVVSESTMEAGGMGGTRSSFGGSQRMSTEDFLRQVVFK